MRQYFALRATTRVALLTVLLGGCLSYYPVTAPAATHLPQDPHTEVRVTRTNGESSRLVGTRFENDSLVGRNFTTGDQREAIAAADIFLIEIGEPDTESTVVFTIAGVVSLLVLFMALLASGWGRSGVS